MQSIYELSKCLISFGLRLLFSFIITQMLTLFPLSDWDHHLFKKNRVFATNLNFLIPISYQSDILYLDSKLIQRNI